MAAMRMASRLPGPGTGFGAGPARHAPGMRLLHRTGYPLVQLAAGVASTPPLRRCWSSPRRAVNT
jgi:hypothetical protein